MSQLWNERDVSLYALSIGLGSESFSEKTSRGHDYLRFVYERHPDFAAFPTMPFGTLFQTNAEAVWQSELVQSCVEFDPKFLVHGEQLIEWPAAKFGLVDSANQNAKPLGYEFFETRHCESVLSQFTPGGFPEYYPVRLVGKMTHGIIAILPKSTGVLICMQSVLHEIQMGKTLCVLTGTMFLRRAKLKISLDGIRKRFPHVNRESFLDALAATQRHHGRQFSSKLKMGRAN